MNAIIGRGIRTANRAGWDHEKVNAFIADAKSGDYDHAIQTCMKYFDVV